jgi:hypothetical protein
MMNGAASSSHSVEAPLEPFTATCSSLEVTHDGPLASEIKLADIQRQSAGSCGDASQVSSRRSIQSGLPEDEELLSLKPTRDFVDNFNQHTSFHRRKQRRNAVEGEASLPVCCPTHRYVADKVTALSALLNA